MNTGHVLYWCEITDTRWIVVMHDLCKLWIILRVTGPVLRVRYAK